MAGEASRLNGKKGGRKKGYPALEAEQARILIARKLHTEFEPIVDKAIEQAKSGGKDAREWLADRAYGKSMQPIVGKDGKDFMPPDTAKKKVKAAVDTFLNERPETDTKDSSK